MLKFVTKLAAAAGLGRLGGALLVLAASLHAASSADADRAARMAKFARPSAVPFPAENPYSPEKAELGRQLFFDPSLSASGTIACATCHHPRLAWGDGLPRAIGEARTPLPLRSPTMLGAAWLEAFGWDGKFPTLESIAFTPLSSPANMGRNEVELLRDIAQNPAYRAAFDRAFPGEGVSRSTVERAMATYQRTIVPAIAPFDRWIAGDEAAITESAKRGFDLFTGRAQCSECHSTWRFTDDSFHDIGTGGEQEQDIGRGKLFPNSPALQFAFKVPTLRDVERRAPYMHDGSLPDLPGVIDLYNRGGVDRPSRDPHVRPLGLTAKERADLLAFLQSLTGEAARAPSPITPR
ncbi:MAG TPA: cytochrome c peroxidase [Bradyrhizobium sp.]|nr:cytochrome c peroxidase [Bradyrhizobium sp.]